MPNAYSSNALMLAISELANRTIQVRLHYGDPGNAGTANAIHASNGYAHEILARGAITQESGSRYSNTADIEWNPASGGNWGDGSNDQPVSWITLWYDASDAANTDANNFDTLMATLRLASSQQVNDGDPFVLRARTLDLVSLNPSV